MSLSASTTSTYSTAVYAGTAEVGCIVETTSKTIGTTNEDRGYDPATGKTVLYGNHCSEEIVLSFSGITFGTTGLMAATVGTSIVFATSVAIAGHAATTRTSIVTGMDFSKDNAGGKFQRGKWDAISLPFTAA